MTVFVIAYKMAAEVQDGCGHGIFKNEYYKKFTPIGLRISILQISVTETISHDDSCQPTQIILGLTLCCCCWIMISIFSLILCCLSWVQSENIMLADKHKIEKDQNGQLRNQVAQLLQVEQEQKLQIQERDSTIQNLKVGADWCCYLSGFSHSHTLIKFSLLQKCFYFLLYNLEVHLT